MNLHNIILSSSYSKGTRIGIDLHEDIHFAGNAVRRIKSECGNDVALSFHSIITADTSWESVVRSDSFFASIFRVDSLSEFIRIIKLDRKLTAVDVARYILTRTNCTHLKLQKLLYMCHADYLCETGEPLFEDTICALPYGPVVSSICDMLKGRYNLTANDLYENSGKELQITPNLNLPARSKILFTENGNKKLNSIDRTLAKYMGLYVFDLVDITHKRNSPWYVAKTKGYHVMSDDLIRNYHKNEEI